MQGKDEENKLNLKDFLPSNIIPEVDDEEANTISKIISEQQNEDQDPLSSNQKSSNEKIPTNINYFTINKFYFNNVGSPFINMTPENSFDFNKNKKYKENEFQNFNQTQNPINQPFFPPKNIYNQNSFNYPLNYQGCYINNNPQNSKINYDNFNNYTKNQGKTKNCIYLNNTNEKMKTKDFLNSIRYLTKDISSYICSQKGGREVQKLLSKADEECKITFINILGSRGLVKAMKDTYGNYFIQQFILSISGYILIKKIINYIYSNVVEIAENYSGTHVLQKLIELLKDHKELQQIVLNSIKGREIEMAMNINSTHVLQKLLMIVSDNERNDLNNLLIENCLILCLDANGTCLMKVFIKTITIKENKERVIQKINRHCLELSQSPYGNYAVQYIYQIFSFEDCILVSKTIISIFIQLCTQKYSSNVIEKILESFQKNNDNSIINLIEKNYINLIDNKYGTFILYKAIKYISQNVRKEMYMNITNKYNFSNNLDKQRIKKFLINLKETIDEFDKNICNNNIKSIISKKEDLY